MSKTSIHQLDYPLKFKIANEYHSPPEYRVAHWTCTHWNSDCVGLGPTLTELRTQFKNFFSEVLMAVWRE